MKTKENNEKTETKQKSNKVKLADIRREVKNAMMKKKYFLFALLLLAASAEAKATDYEIKINASGSIPTTTATEIGQHYTRIFIQAAATHKITNNLLNNNFRTFLARTLERNGYRMTKNPEQADYIIFYEFDRSEPYQVTTRKAEKTAHVVTDGGSGAEYQYVDRDVTVCTHSFRFLGYKKSDLNNPVWEMRTATQADEPNCNIMFPYMFGIGHKYYCRGGSICEGTETFFLGAEKPIVKSVRKYLNNPY